MDLSGARISDLQFLGYAERLQNLVLDDCRALTDLTPVLALPELQRLSVRGCPYLDPYAVEDSVRGRPNFVFDYDEVAFVGHAAG